MVIYDTVCKSWRLMVGQLRFGLVRIDSDILFYVSYPESQSMQSLAFQFSNPGVVS